MQLKLFASLILFIGSYFPLSVILLVQSYRYDLWQNEMCWRLNTATCSIPFKQPIISIGFVIVSLLCLLFTLLVLYKIRVRQQIETTESKYIPSDLMNYVLPYVVSFMGLDYNDIGKFLGFIVFLLWIFVITHKSERIIMNPVLTVAGWKLYELKSKSPAGEIVSTRLALATIPLVAGETYKTNSIQDVLIIKQKG